MGARYLTDLADVLRAWGLTVFEVDGWQTRARGSGGYEGGRPTHLMVHHTASNPSSDPDGDVAYITFNADAAPLANLYLSRSGEVWVCAGGCTNTNGSGHDSWGGGVPDDSMNTHAIGIEAANQGTGEPWAWEQQMAYLRICHALCIAYGIDAHNCRGHFEWAPQRKVDPAGQSSWAEHADSWDMDLFRHDIHDIEPSPEPGPEPTPSPIPEEDDDMAFIIVNKDTGQPALVYGDGKVTGLDGGALAPFVDRYGTPIVVEDVTFNDFANKGD